MLDVNNREMCVMLVDRFGKKLQLTIAIEEMSELTKEICKMLRGGGLECTEGFKEELADVLVMMEQCRIMFGISYYEINERAKNKLERAMRRSGV